MQIQKTICPKDRTWMLCNKYKDKAKFEYTKNFNVFAKNEKNKRETWGNILAKCFTNI